MVFLRLTYTTTEEVVLKLGGALNVPIQPDDIENSHKLNARNNPIIVKFLIHNSPWARPNFGTKLRDKTWVLSVDSPPLRCLKLVW